MITIFYGIFDTGVSVYSSLSSIASVCNTFRSFCKPDEPFHCLCDDDTVVNDKKKGMPAFKLGFVFTNQKNLRLNLKKNADTIILFISTVHVRTYVHPACDFIFYFVFKDGCT